MNISDDRTDCSKTNFVTFYLIQNYQLTLDWQASVCIIIFLIGLTLCQTKTSSDRTLLKVGQTIIVMHILTETYLYTVYN